jgi:hypothetical protein
MDQLKTVVQAGGVTLLVLAIGHQVWKHPGDDEAHIHQDTEHGADKPIGRAASFFAATTSGTMSVIPEAPPGWRITYGHGSKK